MNDQRETKTLPDIPPLTAADVDQVTSLRVAGEESPCELPLERSSFTVGAARSCDVVIRDEYVSGTHCLLKRRGLRICVMDQGSRNGTFFGGRRELSFDIGPGDVFVVANVACLAMNREMADVRSMLLELVDFRASKDLRIATHTATACDSLLAATMRGSHLLLLGEDGCDQARLARGIHRASPRRYATFTETQGVPQNSDERHALLDQARHGTLLLELEAGNPPADERFRTALLAAEYRVRLLVSSPSLHVAVASLGLDVITRLSQVVLSPLRERSLDVPALLDRFLREHGSRVGFADMTAPNQRALVEHSWPRNLAELREAAQRIAVISRLRSLNKAAAALDMPRSTLGYWTTRLNLELPFDGKGSVHDSSPLAIPVPLSD